MGIKLTIFTIFFSCMAIENVFRQLDFYMEWSFPIHNMRMPDSEYDFGSQFDNSILA